MLMLPNLVTLVFFRLPSASVSFASSWKSTSSSTFLLLHWAWWAVQRSSSSSSSSNFSRSMPRSCQQKPEPSDERMERVANTEFTEEGERGKRKEYFIGLSGCAHLPSSQPASQPLMDAVKWCCWANSEWAPTMSAAVTMRTDFNASTHTYIHSDFQSRSLIDC